MNAKTIPISIILLGAFGFGLKAAEDRGRQLMRLALEARLDASVRNRNLKAIAEALRQDARKSIDQVRANQSIYQEPLLLFCDRDLRPALSAEAVESVDEAIETALSLKALRRGGWDRLGYVWGFFNHDATAEQIRRLSAEWAAMPEERREPHYPHFPHLIDAVTKPLSVGPVGDPKQTAAALEVALPVLKSFLMQPPKPGRAFHVPTHAALVLGPLHVRWAGTQPHGDIVRKHLGTRKELVDRMLGRLISARKNPENLSPQTLKYDAYTGRYFANVLARLNDRRAAGPLRKSLSIYRQHKLSSATIRYTRRALAALGDAEERRALQQADRTDRMKTAVWLVRNGRGETVEFGRQLLGDHFNCPPERAMNAYWRMRLEAIAKSQ
ncbi:MAG: hypothetical protein R3236_05250 [Phycisphaeraceae bacterium]|nr:hypothetical protein [Phycisphaeraceae bacterium]